MAKSCSEHWVHKNHPFTPVITVSHMGLGGSETLTFWLRRTVLVIWSTLECSNFMKNGQYDPCTPHTLPKPPGITCSQLIYLSYIILWSNGANRVHSGSKLSQKWEKINFWIFVGWFPTLLLETPGWFRYQKMSHGLKFTNIGKFFWRYWNKGYLWAKMCFSGSKNLKK